MPALSLYGTSDMAGLPVDAVLPKYESKLTSNDYASILVGLSRQAHWRLADSVVRLASLTFTALVKFAFRIGREG